MRSFPHDKDTPSIEKQLPLGVALLLIYAAWARGGIHTPWQGPLVSISVLLLSWALFFDKDRIQSARKRLFRDPVFYLGLFMLLIIVAQWSNSGYQVVWDKADSVGMKQLPSRWLPWSVDRDSAWQMLDWFFPAWTGLWIVRNMLQRDEVMRLLRLVAWNASLLAVVGMVQVWSGAEKMLGLWSIPGNSFFATFGYANHAGAFFYLNAALSAGLAHDALQRHGPPVQTAVWGACFLLCIVAAFMTLSRAAALAALVLLLTVIAVFVLRSLKRSGRSAALNTGIAVVVVALIGITLYLGVGKGALAAEMEKTAQQEGVMSEVEARAMQRPQAWEIIKEYPLFGSGGWGYRWLAKLHIPVNEWSSWKAPGKANVHCDPLQFLSEFGTVGALCAGLSVAIILGGAAGVGHRSASAYWIAGGLLLVFAHSWLDLPFRSPAILLEWGCLLAALPHLTSRRDIL